MRPAKGCVIPGAGRRKRVGVDDEQFRPWAKFMRNALRGLWDRQPAWFRTEWSRRNLVLRLGPGGNVRIYREQLPPKGVVDEDLSDLSY